MDLMNIAGKTIYLKLHPTSIFTRLTQSKKKRPLILDKPPEELQNFIISKLAEREAFYSKAQHIVKGENLEIEDLLKLI
jgi:shikimate kinase